VVPHLFQVGPSLFGLLLGLLLTLPAVAVPLNGSLGVHDPSRIHREGGRYYLYATGNFTPSKYSDDFQNWQDGPRAFPAVPQWARDEVPASTSSMWAPDVFHYNNEYRLYYSVSSFGSQNSVVGMATNNTLDFTSPNYLWVDQGMVIESEVGSPYNSIDPAIFSDHNTGRMWMTFGSFWNGIYITELDPETGKPAPGSRTVNIARNPASPGNAIEAPFLTKHDDNYYLFVNWDLCCRGVNSTYKIRVGRGTSPAGPFLDRSGVAMTAGGGELFLATEGNAIGPGHFSDFSENGINYFSYHYYDGNANGASKLAIDEFAWTHDGWPVLVSTLPPGDYNRDGLVGAADYTVWRNTVGTSSHVADGNGDGIVDSEDFDLWKAHYGDSLASGATQIASVPEPLNLALLALLCATCQFAGRASRHATRHAS
jgi:arabinan endo-1,5-alpha-L-arabinosidase